MENMQEIISQLVGLKEHCESMVDETEPGCIWKADCSAIEAAILVLKMQVPAKPVDVSAAMHTAPGTRHQCPVCRAYLQVKYPRQRYCFVCGQALDWGARE